MTLATPGLIADTTATDGVSTYTLTGVTSDGYRSLANAVSAGHAANGQTVYYSVRDTTTSGGSLNFEIGIGTIGGAGTSLARTTIIESSNADAAVDWVLGGSRQVLIAIGAQGLAILTAANAFSGNNTFGGTSTFNGAVTSTQDVTVNKSGSTAVLNVLSDQSTGAPARLRLGGHNSAAADTYYFILQSVITDATAASEDSRGDVLLYSAGSQVTTHRLNNDGSITNVITGDKFDHFPSGQILTSGTTPPADWTRVDDAGERIVKLSRSSDTIGATGGGWTVTGLSVTVATHALTTAELAPHTHEYTAGALAGTTHLAGASFTQTTPASGTGGFTANAGSGTAHGHPGSSASQDGTWRPPYKIFCQMSKN